MRAAKARSAESGESLKSLLTRAVAAELESHVPRGARARVTLPLFGASAGPRVRLSNADVERALAESDAAAVRAVARTPATEKSSRPRGRAK